MAEMNEDIVASADKLVQSLNKDEKTGHAYLTRSQIRKFLSAVIAINNKIQALDEIKDQLPQNIANEIKYLKVKLIYQAGRTDTRSVKNLIEEGKLFQRIDEIAGNRTRFFQFSKFVEAIVAYHKYYYGGRD